MELNLSCPHGMGERGMGLACGQVYSHTHTHRMLMKTIFSVLKDLHSNMLNVCVFDAQTF